MFRTIHLKKGQKEFHVTASMKGMSFVLKIGNQKLYWVPIGTTPPIYLAMDLEKIINNKKESTEKYQMTSRVPAYKIFFKRTSKDQVKIIFEWNEYSDSTKKIKNKTVTTETVETRRKFFIFSNEELEEVYSQMKNFFFWNK